MKKQNQQALFDKWKDVPEGTDVIVTKDDGELFHTKTRSVPWMLGLSSRGPGHTAVIKVAGIVGGYALDRISLVDKPFSKFPLLTIGRKDALLEAIRKAGHRTCLVCDECVGHLEKIISDQCLAALKSLGEAGNVFAAVMEKQLAADRQIEKLEEVFKLVLQFLNEGDVDAAIYQLNEAPKVKA